MSDNSESLGCFVPNMASLSVIQQYLISRISVVLNKNKNRNNSNKNYNKKNNVQLCAL